MAHQKRRGAPRFARCTASRCTLSGVALAVVLTGAATADTLNVSGALPIRAGIDPALNRDVPVTGSLHRSLPTVSEAGSPLGDPVGACCICPDDACLVLTEPQCAAFPGLYLGDGTSCDLPPGETIIIDSGALSLPIPDSDPTGVSHNLNMGMSFAVQDVNVILNITHTRIGDLCVTLAHGATSVELIVRPGTTETDCQNADGSGCVENNYAITLDDAAGSAIEDACTPGGTIGVFIPNNALSAFSGSDSSGLWTISVTDNAGGDTGTLGSWALAITQPSTADPVCQCEPCGNGIVDAPFEDCDPGLFDPNDCCDDTCHFVVAGDACGSGPGACSSQDTCDVAGLCLPNHAPAGSPCGSPANECSAQDTCDGAGNCNLNDSPVGSQCGAPSDMPGTCFTGDACSGGGVCLPGSMVTACVDNDSCCNRPHGCNADNDNDCDQDVPTVSAWGLLVLALMLAAAAKVNFGRRRQARA